MNSKAALVAVCSSGSCIAYISANSSRSDNRTKTPDNTFSYG